MAALGPKKSVPYNFWNELDPPSFLKLFITSNLVFVKTSLSYAMPVPEPDPCARLLGSRARGAGDQWLLLEQGKHLANR